jgi:hypothetical protein
VNVTEGYIELGAKMAASCRENPEAFANLLVTAPSQRSVLFTIYNALRMKNELKSLEGCDEKTRRYYWTEAKALSMGRLPQEKLILLSKCIYTIEYLLANY